MMFDRKAEGRYWDFGWQLVEGCTRIADGCKHCWSLDKERRFRKETGVVCHEERLERPLKRRKPASYAVWNDLFHEDVPFNYIYDVYFTAYRADRHIYLILTKRAERALEFYDWLRVRLMKNILNLPNVWLGVSCSNQAEADKNIPILLQIPAPVRFVSFEPLLKGILLRCRLRAEQLDWAIVGGESGPGARPMHAQWVRSIRDQCVAAGVPFFFKGWGEWLPDEQIDWNVSGQKWTKVPLHPGLAPAMSGSCAMMRVGKKKAGRVLDGRTWDEYPKDKDAKIN